MDIVLEDFFKHEFKLGTLGTVAVMVFSVIANLGHGIAEHPLGSLYLA